MMYYDLSKLVKIEVNDLIQSQNYFLLDKDSKFLWFTIMKAGVHCLRTNKFIRDAPEHHLIIDGGVFIKPCVTLHYIGGITSKHYFEYLEYAEEFAQGIISRKDGWIREGYTGRGI